LETLFKYQEDEQFLDKNVEKKFSLQNQFLWW